MTASMTFRGGISQALVQARQAFGDEQAEAELQKALLSGARLLQAEAQSRASRSARPRGRAGHLAERGIGAALTQPEDQDVPGVGAQVGPLRRWYYGLFLEFGTRKMAARPFIRPSLGRLPEVVNLVAESFKRRIERLQRAGSGA